MMSPYSHNAIIEHVLNYVKTSAKFHKRRMPQRRNGKLRVATAILKAGEAVIVEKGYEAATMAEIAARSNTKIRFRSIVSFPIRKSWQMR